MHRHFLTARAAGGRQPHVGPGTAPLQRRRGHALCPARPATTSTGTGTRMGDEIVYVSQGERHARDPVWRPAVPRRRLPRHPSPSSSIATGSTRSHTACWSWRAAAMCARPSATGTNSGSWWRAPRSANGTSAARMELRPHDEAGDFPILVKQYDGLTELVLDHHPCDVVGWDGYFYPWAFNIHDFEPIVGRIHQPPPVHQTFQGDGFVVCSFCPRPYDFDPEAIPAPYNHSNVDSDEVLYYASSEFMSRKGIEYGSDHAPPGRHPARAPPGPGGGEHRGQGDQRTGRDDGHLPPAARGESRAPDRGPALLPVLDRDQRRGLQPTHVLSREPVWQSAARPRFTAALMTTT